MTGQKSGWYLKSYFYAFGVKKIGLKYFNHLQMIEYYRFNSQFSASGGSGLGFLIRLTAGDFVHQAALFFKLFLFIGLQAFFFQSVQCFSLFHGGN